MKGSYKMKKCKSKIYTYKDVTGKVVTNRVYNIKWQGKWVSFEHKGIKLYIQFFTLRDALYSRFFGKGNMLLGLPAEDSDD